MHAAPASYHACKEFIHNWFNYGAAHLLQRLQIHLRVFLKGVDFHFSIFSEVALLLSSKLLRRSKPNLLRCKSKRSAAHKSFWDLQQMSAAWRVLPKLHVGNTWSVCGLDSLLFTSFHSPHMQQNGNWKQCIVLYLCSFLFVFFFGGKCDSILLK